MNVPTLEWLEEKDYNYKRQLPAGRQNRPGLENEMMSTWLPNWLETKNAVVRDAAAINFAHWSAVASSYPLPRFAQAVAARTSALDQADQLLLMQVQLHDMRAEVEALRPPAPGVLQLC